MMPQDKSYSDKKEISKSIFFILIGIFLFVVIFLMNEMVFSLNTPQNEITEQYRISFLSNDFVRCNFDGTFTSDVNVIDSSENSTSFEFKGFSAGEYERLYKNKTTLLADGVRIFTNSGVEIIYVEKINIGTKIVKNVVSKEEAIHNSFVFSDFSLLLLIGKVILCCLGVWLSFWGLLNLIVSVIDMRLRKKPMAVELKKKIGERNILNP